MWGFFRGKRRRRTRRVGSKRGKRAGARSRRPSRRTPGARRKRRLVRLVLAVAVVLGAGALAAGFFLGGCSRLPEVTAPWTESPRESYAETLEESGLASTALGRAWHAAGSRALERPVEVRPPYRETVFFDPAEPEAAGYRLALRRGQRLRVTVAGDGEETGRGAEEAPSPRRFIDLFEEPGTGGGEPKRLTSAEEEPVLEHAVRRDGTYLVRIQPELLVGGRLTVTLEALPTLVFPVEGKDRAAIRSFFGDPRDAGRRSHKGVDIFAPRGTPAVAAADARVIWVGSNRLGGKTVWLYAEELGLALYYAHLDRQEVRRGERVHAGQIVGRVGNTGNARNTPTHLHFGVRDGRAVDPWPYLVRLPGELTALAVDPELLGGWSRVIREGSRLRTAPRRDAGRVAELARWTPVEVHAGHGDWLRVGLPDGTRGFLAARLTEPAREPFRRQRLESPELLRHRPSPRAPAVGELLGGEEIGVLGEGAGVLYVEGAVGKRGWIRSPSDEES
jgi:murein DD-endopeptidase MepM/ murein hydrolase activator NlpD